MWPRGRLAGWPNLIYEVGRMGESATFTNHGGGGTLLRADDATQQQVEERIAAANFISQRINSCWILTSGLMEKSVRNKDRCSRDMLPNIKPTTTVSDFLMLSIKKII